jgi:hypothetical protein
VEWGSRSIGRPSVEPNRRNGDSLDSFEAESMGCEDMPGAKSAHMFGQSSMGKGASNIEGGIIALNCITAAFVLNSGHAYSDLHSSQRIETTARSL